MEFELRFSTLCKQGTRDDHPLDLVGAFINLGYLGIPHHPLNRVVLDVAVAAHDLHRVGGHPHRDVGGERLRYRRQVTEVRDLMVDGRCRPVDYSARCLDLDGHVGEEELDRLMLQDGLAEGSALAGVTIGESHLRELVGLTVAGIVRGEETLLAVEPDERVQVGDQLVVTGESGRIRSLLALGEVELQQDVAEAGIESDEVGIVEAAMAPRSRMAGRTLADVNFRERYGLQVLAIWRNIFL